MTSRRKLKKNVQGVFDCLISEFLYLAANTTKANNESLKALIDRIIKSNCEYITRISHTEPGNVKGFYKKLHTDIKAEVNAITEEFKKLA